MKKILVPTDFSACAANASNVAIELAEYYNAKLYFYHNMYLPEGWISMTAKQKAKHDEIGRRVKNNQTLIREWEGKAIAKGVTVESTYGSGNLIENIKELSDEKEIDFVVMGSHGMSGKSEYFIGSNTQKAVRMLNCPVFIVKEDLTKYEVNKVVFASGFNEDEKAAFRYFLEFIKPFNPEVHLLAINTSSWFGQPYTLMKDVMDDFKEICKDYPCKTHFFRGWTVDGGIRNFIDLMDIDLVAVSNLSRRPFKRMFSGSNVEMLVNHSGVPVLTIDLPEEVENQFKIEDMNYALK